MRPIVLTIYFTQVGSEFTRAHKFKKAPGLQFLDMRNVYFGLQISQISFECKEIVSHMCLAVASGGGGGGI